MELEDLLQINKIYKLYRVIPVHYLQKAEKKTGERIIQYRRGEKRMAINDDQAVQPISVFIGLLLSTNSMY